MASRRRALRRSVAGQRVGQREDQRAATQRQAFEASGEPTDDHPLDVARQPVK